MGRLVTKIVVLLALAWGGWWWIGTGGMQRAAQNWLETLPTQGIHATVTQMERGGFPMRLATTAQDIKWVDEIASTTTHIPTATLSTTIYWPGDAQIKIPAGPITITNPQTKLTILTTGTQAEMLLHPSQSLQLEAISAQADKVALDLPEGRILSVDTLQANIQQGDDPATYTIDLTAFGFAFGDKLKGELELPAEWPDTFEPIIADMAVTFDRPWDRDALDTNRPQPRRINIEKLEVIYADLALSLAGDLTVNNAGTPSGVVSLTLRNWQQLFDILVATTEIPPQWRGTVEQLLGALADAEGNLDLDLTFAQGQMRVGFFPLGPAPQLIIR